MTRPSASAQTCPSASNSDLKPSAIATRTTAAKTRKLRSRSVVTVVVGLVYRSSEIGGVFIGPGEVYSTSPLSPQGRGLAGGCGGPWLRQARRPQGGSPPSGGGGGRAGY